MESQFTAWLITLTTAVLAAYLASTLTLQRSKRERRWDAKHEAYRQIFGSLSDIHFWADNAYAGAMMLPTVGTEKGKGLAKGYDEAKHQLWNYARFGQLTISKGSQGALEELLGALANEEFEFENDPVDEHEYQQALGAHAEKVRTLIDTGLTKLTLEAVDDLS